MIDLYELRYEEQFKLLKKFNIWFSPLENLSTDTCIVYSP